MVDHPLLLIILVVANGPLYRAIGSLLFENADDVQDAVYYWLIPDIIALFRRNWWEEQWAGFRLGIFAVVSGLTVAAEYTAITKLTTWVAQ